MERLHRQIINIAQLAKAASCRLATVSTKQKDKALLAMAKALDKNTKVILKANQSDILTAKDAGLSPALIDRLMLTDKRLKAMSESLKEIAKLKDFVGEIINAWQRPYGLLIRKVRVPIGVIVIIYESRPNVTSDCIGLCLKSGNAVILKGGKEAINSNLAIFKVLKTSLIECGIPNGSINFISSTDRSAVRILLGLDNFVDLVMPRGGEGLVNEVMKFSKIMLSKG